MTWPIGIDFRQAIDWLKRRAVTSRPVQAAIAAGAAAEAFWISDVALLSVVSDVYESIAGAVQAGQSFEAWRSQVIADLRANYPANMADAEIDRRVELVFRNSVQRAYSDGRYQQAQEPAVKRARPYFMYDAILDSRTTTICRGLNGTIRPQDDVFWNMHTPPLHHACRSGLRTLSQRQVDARGGVTVDPHAEEVPEGFGARPGTAPPYRPSTDRYPAPLTAALQRRATERGEQ